MRDNETHVITTNSIADCWEAAFATDSPGWGLAWTQTETLEVRKL